MNSRSIITWTSFISVEFAWNIFSQLAAIALNSLCLHVSLAMVDLLSSESSSKREEMVLVEFSASWSGSSLVCSVASLYLTLTRGARWGLDIEPLMRVFPYYQSGKFVKKFMPAY